MMVLEVEVFLDGRAGQVPAVQRVQVGLARGLFQGVDAALAGFALAIGDRRLRIVDSLMTSSDGCLIDALLLHRPNAAGRGSVVSKRFEMRGGLI